MSVRSCPYGQNSRELGRDTRQPPLPALGPLTGHGFRSRFHDRVSEKDYPREVAEMALAHVVANKVEAAYLRGDLLDKQRELMKAWATYCG
jgi:hypothetical protein